MSRLVLPGELVTRAGNISACLFAITHDQRGLDDRQILLALCDQVEELNNDLRNVIEEYRNEISTSC